MPKTRDQKKEILRDLTGKIGRAKSVIFTKFTGLGVKEVESLRRELRSEEGEYYVAKKTLLNLALKDAKLDDFKATEMDGQVGTVFGFSDQVAPAKIVDKFKKGKEDKIEFLGGILDGRFITAEEVSNLAKLPSRQELYSQIVGSINAPVSGFVNVLAGNLRGLVNVLAAVNDKRSV